MRLVSRLTTLAACVAAVVGCAAAPAAARATVVPPPVNGRFDYQIGGAYTPLPSVTIVDRDRGDRPAAGRYNICYVNAFQSQAEDKTFWTTQHPDLLVTKNGKPVGDPGWPGEYVLNTSTDAKRQALLAIVGGWIDGCARDGFQAVEPDNLDSWTRSQGMLTKAQNIAFAALLATRAHADGLAIAQKNTTQLGTAGRDTVHFDFAIAEECQRYSECGAYTDVYGDHVIEIEYTDYARRFYTAACTARGASVSVILRDRNVVPSGRPAYRYEAC